MVLLFKRKTTLNYFSIIFLIFIFKGCVSYKENGLYPLNEQEKQEALLQKEILITEMANSSKKIHKIAWPILRNNSNICKKSFTYSYGMLFASPEDIPEKENFLFKALFNSKINKYLYDDYEVNSFPIILSVAKDSPADLAGLENNDIILKINDKNTKNFRKSFKKSITHSNKLKVLVFRNGNIIEKKIEGINICDYSIQPFPAGSPNAFADGKKVFITIAAIKLAESDDELAFLIGHELAHNIFHYNTGGASEAYTESINYLDRPKIRNVSAIFTWTNEKRETEADIEGTKIAFKGGYNLDKVSDYWRRLSVFNPNYIKQSSYIYRSNAARAVIINKTLKKLKDEENK